MMKGCKKIYSSRIMGKKAGSSTHYRNIQANYKNKLETYLLQNKPKWYIWSKFEVRLYTAKIARIPIRLKLQQIAQPKLIPSNIYMKENQK